MRLKNGYRRARRAGATAGLLATTLMMVACASAPVAPTSSLEAARVAISNAERADAGSHAAAELDRARQKLRRADEAVAGKTENEMRRAERLAQEAQLEAELALARTDAAKAAAVNQQLSSGVDALTEELKRSGDQR